MLGKKRMLSYRKAVYSALDQALGSDAKVVFMGEDISEYGGAFGVAGDLSKKYPSRVISTPISEGGFTGVAVGLAMTGFRPVVEIMFMDFLTLAMDQIVNHAANVHYMYGGQLSCPLVVRTPAGGYRGYGASHSKAMESAFLSVEGLKIVAPSTVSDAYGCLLSAIYDNNPVLFVEHKLLYNLEEEVEFGPDYRCELGRAQIIKEGTDVTVVTHSYGTVLANEAVHELQKEGINAELIDLRTLKPIDIETVAASVKKTGRLVSVEEGNVSGGIGAEVVSRIAERCLEYLDGRIIRVGKPDVPIPASIAAETRILPGADDIIRAVRNSLSWRHDDV